MSAFTPRELAYLQGERRLTRISTVGKNGTRHVAPVGWSYNSEQDTIDVGGHNFAQIKKYRDVQATGRAPIVIDDLASTNPVAAGGRRGPSGREAHGGPPLIRLYRERVVSWGLVGG